MTVIQMLSCRHLLNTTHIHACGITAYPLYFLMPNRLKEILTYISVLCLALLSHPSWGVTWAMKYYRGSYDLGHALSIPCGVTGANISFKGVLESPVCSVFANQSFFDWSPDWSISRFQDLLNISLVYKVNSMRCNYYNSYYIYALIKQKEWEHTILHFRSIFQIRNSRCPVHTQTSDTDTHVHMHKLTATYWIIKIKIQAKMLICHVGEITMIYTIIHMLLYVNLGCNMIRLDQTAQMPRLNCFRWVHRSFCWICHASAHLV